MDPVTKERLCACWKSQTARPWRGRMAEALYS